VPRPSGVKTYQGARLACLAMPGLDHVVSMVRDEFTTRLVGLSNILDLKADLPQRPFLGPGGYVGVADFDWVWDFAPVLESLAGRHGDDEIVVVALDQANAGSEEFHPGFRMPPSALFDGFRDAVHHERHSDLPWTFAILAEEVAITGSSQRWSVWGSRGWELVLVHDTAGPGRWLHVGVPFLRPSEGLPRYLRGVPPAVLETFRSNFPDLHEGTDPAAPRPLADAEAAMVDFLLLPEFPGVRELRIQRQQLQVNGLWRDLPGAVIFERDDGNVPMVDGAGGAAVRAGVRATDSELEVVLFTALGVLDSIIVMNRAGDPQSLLPAVEDLDPPSAVPDRARRQPHHPWPPPAA
jgi:hypothetical protein